jgi:predicted nuclease of predicted toxin-antitoxin system
LPPDILADESLDFRIAMELQKKGFHVISVLKAYQGSSDKKVLDLARQHKAILITEDSDFGEWIFAHQERGVSVIFLRYKAEEMQDMVKILINFLNKYGDSLERKFVVITTKKLRIRKIF